MWSRLSMIYLGVPSLLHHRIRSTNVMADLYGEGLALGAKAWPKEGGSLLSHHCVSIYQGQPELIRDCASLA